MNINSFKDYHFQQICPPDDTQRNIGYSTFENVQLIGRNTFYPNTLMLTENLVVSPYDEKVMSLNKSSFYDNNEYTSEIILSSVKHTIECPVFFFIYNFDNYYHFLYDSLPYLWTYFYLKKNLDDTIKLLINYPNKNKQNFYAFNTEFLYKLVNPHDIIIHNEDNYYSKIYVSSSFTHGGFSNNPPRKEIFDIYEKIKQNIDLTNISEKYFNIDKAYISRRTWIHNDNTNIGTNYTTRRKMMNEDELVEELTSKGFVEIFAERLNTDEKIYLFSRAKEIIGSIGGGMANLLFSSKNTKSIVIVSPYFLDINYRFKYSMDHTDITYFDNVKTYKEDNDIPLNCRVKITNVNSMHCGKIGEICDYKDGKYLINLSQNDVAGFNNELKFDKDWLQPREFELLDKGLNSPYVVEFFNFID